MSEKIEGLAPWLKIKRIGFIKTGEHFLDKNPGVDAKVRTSSGYYDSQLYIVVDADNIYNSVFLDHYTVPHTYRRIKGTWFGRPAKGDYFVTADGSIVLNHAFNFGEDMPDNRRIIVEPIKQRFLVVKFPMRWDKPLGPEVDRGEFKYYGNSPVSIDVVEE